jgi:hypothetical protein
MGEKEAMMERLKIETPPFWHGRAIFALVAVLLLLAAGTLPMPRTGCC